MHRCLKFGVKHWLTDLNQVCSDDGPRIQNAYAPGDLGFDNKTFRSSSPELLSSALEISYVALCCGNLPRLFKWWPEGPKRLAKGVLGLNLRNTEKTIQKSLS